MNTDKLKLALVKLRKAEAIEAANDPVAVACLSRLEAIALLEALGLVYVVGRAENGADQTGLDISSDTFASCSDVADVIDDINRSTPTPK